VTSRSSKVPAVATGAVIPFAGCGDDVADEVGGKALGLGFLTGQGFSVPAGFAITVSAYRKAVAAAGLEDAINEILLRPISDPEMSMAIIELFDTVAVPDDVTAQVAAAYEQIGAGPIFPDTARIKRSIFLVYEVPRRTGIPRVLAIEWIASTARSSRSTASG
jgi:pyruvate, water dikinase